MVVDPPSNLARPSINADKSYSTHTRLVNVNHIAGKSVLWVVSIILAVGNYIQAVDLCWHLLEGVSATGRLSVN